MPRTARYRLPGGREAVEAFRQCRAVYESIFGPEAPAVGRVLNNIGALLTEVLERPLEGEPLLRRAVTIFEAEGADLYWRALTRWPLANSLRNQRRFAEATRLYAEAEGTLRELGGAQRVDHPDLAQLLADRQRLDEMDNQPEWDQ